MKNNTINFYDIISSNAEIYYAIHTAINSSDFPQVHDFFEFSLITKGTLNIEINNQMYSLKQNQIIFVKPNDVHSKSIPRNQESEHLNFVISNELLQNIFHSLGLESIQAEMINHFFIHPQVLTLQMTNYIKEQIDLLNHSYFNNLIKSKATARLIIMEIIMKVYFPLISDSLINKAEYQHEWLSPLLSDINDKDIFTQPPRIMTTLVHKDYSYVCRVFKAELNSTPTDYFNDLRLDYAKNLMLRTNIELLDIIFDSGFNSVPHFYKLFKNKFKQTPINYRKKYQITT